MDFISDHFLVYAEAADVRGSVGVKVFKSRCLRTLEYETVTEYLSLTPFDDVLYISDVEDKVACFTRLMIGLYDELAPVRFIRCRKNYKPWFTSTIKKLISLKNAALNKFKQNRTSSNWDYYKNIRNATTAAVNREKKAYVQFAFDGRGVDSRILWTRLGELGVHVKTAAKTIPPTLDKPQDLNNFFLKFSQTLSANQVNDAISYYSSSSFAPFEERLHFTLTDEDEIYDIIKSIYSGAIGPDGLNVEMLLRCCPHILRHLVNICNSCIIDAKFPDSWKVSKVVPIPKVSNPTSFNDIRPISILSPCAKVVEKILAVRIRSHLDKFNILPPRQSGFRKGYGCCTALLDIVDTIIRNVDTGKSCVLLLLDYSKALDRVNHQLMTAILRHIGLSDVAG
ncbi:uncharacterized protein LOC123310323 [Coccinella septempunctata]|uniref:uncharacterized protein LOC123310323 n=1 Tax=Coccinella septempunctata TaxID=41139 RepID=UPI001D08E86E|nr:uncharacterized protein LOC123310323 [Coccinella septempunctata]